jgi:DNA-binding NarL/FixJ family response regulator
MSVSILLVDDNEMFRKGVRSFLKEQVGLQVIGEAGSGADALVLVEQFAPDVILLDWQMPGMSGLVVLCKLMEMKILSRVIILSMHSDEVYVNHAFLNGAYGYVLKDHIVNHLPKAIHSVVQGGHYISFPVQNINAT